MNVGQLIEKLSQYPDDVEVRLARDGEQGRIHFVTEYESHRKEMNEIQRAVTEGVIDEGPDTDMLLKELDQQNTHIIFIGTRQLFGDLPKEIQNQLK